MKVLILYRPVSEHARIVEEFVHDFEHRWPGKNVEMSSLDTREGAATASLYGVMQYPAILVLANDGQLLQLWVGDMMPRMDEVASYADL